MNLTIEAKRELYRNGNYKFKPPPVHHTWWTEDDWIHYIDKEGIWTKPIRCLNANCRKPHPKVTYRAVPRTAWYQCEHCGHEWEDNSND